jgi:PAS domain S-box-containing protein
MLGDKQLPTNGNTGQVRLSSIGADRELFRALFDELPQLAWTAQPDGYVDHYNRGWYEYTGMTYEETKGWGWQSVHRPDELPRVMEAWTRSIATGQYFELEFPLRRKDGTYRWFLARAKPICDTSGRVIRWVGVNTDIDAQKGMALHAEEQGATAQRAVRSREDLLAIVSHDLRNPLSAVLLAAKQVERLADGSVVGPRLKKAAGTIVKSVDIMSRLVGNLLDLAKLEVGRALPIDSAPVDIADLIRQALLLLEPLVTARRLTLHAQGLTAPLFALCDGDRIQQVLSNLVGNAIKFTREGGDIRVALTRVGQEVVVSVNDTGTGIADDQLPHIFTPYWQADASTKRGAGLGLSIAKAIVDAHGGRIWVVSTAGEGSTFSFTLPATDAMQAPKEDG